MDVGFLDLKKLNEFDLDFRKSKKRKKIVDKNNLENYFKNPKILMSFLCAFLNFYFKQDREKKNNSFNEKLIKDIRNIFIKLKFDLFKNIILHYSLFFYEGQLITRVEGMQDDFTIDRVSFFISFILFGTDKNDFKSSKTLMKKILESMNSLKELKIENFVCISKIISSYNLHYTFNNILRDTASGDLESTNILRNILVLYKMSGQFLQPIKGSDWNEKFKNNDLIPNNSNYIFNGFNQSIYIPIDENYFDYIKVFVDYDHNQRTVHDLPTNYVNIWNNIKDNYKAGIRSNLDWIDIRIPDLNYFNIKKITFSSDNCEFPELKVKINYDFGNIHLLGESFRLKIDNEKKHNSYGSRLDT